MSAAVWRFVKRGRVRHAMHPRLTQAWCGLRGRRWFGGTTQEEARMQGLPACQTCKWHVGEQGLVDPLRATPDDVVDGQRCEPLFNDAGELVAVARVSPEMTDDGRAALLAVVDAARRQFEVDLATDPSMGDRQRAAVQRIRDRASRPGGAR